MSVRICGSENPLQWEHKDMIQRRPAAWCAGHTRYTAGCTECRFVSAGYRETRRDAVNRGRASRAAAYRRLAEAHPEEYQRYFAEETAARTPPTAEADGRRNEVSRGKTPARKTCDKTGKISHRTRTEAFRAALGSSAAFGKPIRAYRCEACPHWHLTSKKEGKRWAT